MLFSSVAKAFGLDGISAGHKPASRHKGGFDLKTISMVSACSSDAVAHQFVLQLMMPHTCFLYKCNLPRRVLCCHTQCPPFIFYNTTFISLM